MSVLLLTALVVLLVSHQVYEMGYLIKTTNALLDRSQAGQYALSGEAYAVEILLEGLEQKADGADHLNGYWNLQKRDFSPENGSIVITIEDLQGRFNINNLVDFQGNIDANSVEQFQNFLQHLNIPPMLALSVADWLDKDQIEQGINTEDGYYQSKKNSYYAADQRIQDVTELAVVSGFEQYYKDALPYLCALPEKTPVNINTAAAPVIASLSRELNPATVISSRNSRKNGFSTVNEFFLDKSVQNTSISSPVSVSSSYFLATITTSFSDARVTLQSILHRDRNSRTINVIARTLVPPQEAY